MSRRGVAVSRASADALRVLGNQIRLARHARGWTIADLAARIDASRRTIANIESGAATVSIGTVFNAAFTVGVNLFGLEGPELARARRQGEDTLALLPSKVRKPASREEDDDDLAF
jgi:transcriptional regulator with XRE-family HTH domain